VHPGSGDGASRHKESDYDLWVDRGTDVAVDAAGGGNEGRFVNDYRGVPAGGAEGAGKGDGRGNKKEREKGKEKGKEGKKKGPNAEFKEVWDERFGERGMGVFVLPVRKKAVGREREVGIARGEEILVSYGKGFWGERRGEEAEAEEGIGGDRELGKGVEG